MKGLQNFERPRRRDKSIEASFERCYYDDNE